MPSPTSIDELLELTKKSKVVEDDRLTAYVQQLRNTNSLPTEPNKLAGQMIRDGLLTLFQAEQLLMGKWKRFFIGKYKVLERLGSGGMAQVFLCEHRLMRRRVAVKVLPAAKAEDPSSLERFHREARAVAALDHPNIVRAYDIDADDSGGTVLHFLVMEYVDGASLQEIIKRSGPMDPTRACHYIAQAAIGLQHAYDKAGLVHRDIKPGNILIDRTGIVKILDMGLARFFHDEEDLLTKKYDESVLGTADYLAPEQAIDSHSVTIRADIYSLGATFYFMLTGSPPFTEGTVAQKLIWHQTRMPKSVSVIRSDVPQPVVAVIEKMMAKDANSRYQWPNEVAEALAPFTTGSIPPPPDIEMPKLSPAAMGPGVPSATSPPTRIIAPQSPRPARVNSSRSDITLPAAPANPPPTALPQRRNPAPPPAPPPAVAPRVVATNSLATATEETGQVWTGLMADTPHPKPQSDTLRTKPLYRPPSAAMMAPGSSRGLAVTNRWILLVGAAVLVAVLAVAAALAFGLFTVKKKTEHTGNAGGDANGTPVLYVDAAGAGQPNTFRRVGEALLKAKAGDTIYVRGSGVEEFWEKMDHNRIAKNVVIEAQVPTGEYMPWRLPASAPATSSVLVLTAVEGLTFRNFVFDGQNTAKNGIYLTARCPGVTFENCRVQNCVDSAIKLSNAVGEPDRPITFRHVRVMPGKPSAAAVNLFAHPTMGFLPADENVLVEDCLLEGPTNAVLAVDGSVKNVVVRRNRANNAEFGLLLKAPKAGQSYELTVAGNTFSRIQQSALKFDGSPLPDASGKLQSQITISQNLFANCKAVCTTAGAAPVATTFKGNAKDPASADGNFPIGAKPVEFAFINATDPNRPDYLRYARAAAPAHLPDGPAGAPPVE
ncbi:MAG: protein kinase domain-containing protein [Gemmataceae bacterium]